MRITATQIYQWAEKPEAKGLLPVLVRRLINATSSPTELSIRGADSLNLPGWDGTLNVAKGNAWVPVGQSRWEMGGSADVAGKARDDLKKRTAETSREVAANLDFIFVSPRRWIGKKDWQEEATAVNHWRNVRAHDADDLEAWLEAAPSVTLWFGEQLGLWGPGIESIGSYWDTWRGQTMAHLTVEAINTGRESCVVKFGDTLFETPALIVLEADSTEEAVAFACAQLVAFGHSDNAACITSPEGWRYVDANQQMRFLVAASPEIAARRAAKEGSILIVPMNIGDRPDYFSPPVAQAAEAQRLMLERPDAESFEKALVGLGEDCSEAARLTRSTGRSWSVYRRIKAANPAIAQPAWIKDPSARCLTAIVLVGGWNDAAAADIACLEAVTGKNYEDLERDLLHMAHLDDSPVLKIGTVWKAKAPLELLYLFASAFTRSELTRFFAAAEAILAKPDPALQLEPDQRWMASVYGKVREESGIVIHSITDSLAKLSVYAENNNDERIASGVHGLVRTLLEGADGDRWLSLSSVLRELAESSPEIFLRAVEGSLERHDAPIRRLFTETSGDAVFGRHWHANLLWALETLAWSPKYVGYVTDILARLSSSALPANVSNRPMKSLVSLFRPWWPQTTAAPKPRLAALDHLIKMRNDVAWDLLVALIPEPSGFAVANAKPHWRGDAASAVGPNDLEGIRQYFSEINARIVAQSQGVPVRIAKLVESLDSFDGQDREQIVRQVETSAGFPDDDRELIRGALRKYLSWHYSYNRRGKRTRTTADRLRPQFDALKPTNLVTRHTWLFLNDWVEMPDGRDDDYEKADEIRERLRSEALQKIFSATGWTGIEELIRRAGSPGLIGKQIARADFPEADVAAWTLKRFADVGGPLHDPVLNGLVHALPLDRRTSLLTQSCAKLDALAIAAFASFAPCDRATWSFLDRQPSDARRIYWQRVQPGGMIAEDVDLEYFVDQMMEAGRHRTAFQAIHIGFKRADAARVLALLEAISIGADPDGPLPDGGDVGEAMKAIEKSGIASRRQLALLEFRYFYVLEHGEHGTKILYSEMLEDSMFFMGFVCVACPPFSQPHTDEPADEAVQAFASLAGSVLHHGRGVPGRIEGGGIDRVKFDSWIGGVRKLAADQDRCNAADVTIGKWLSNCPADPDGIWPCLPVRDQLEQPGTEKIRRGFLSGVIENRGVHSRAIGAGGGQERDLAARYRGFAAPLQGSHPQTAVVLEAIAKRYDTDGRSQDVDSALWKEGVY
ncbi:MAG: hypothetical protein ABJC13_09980 [Acidobacteriota bacterium]